MQCIQEIDQEQNMSCNKQGSSGRFIVFSLESSVNIISEWLVCLYASDRGLVSNVVMN